MADGRRRSSSEDPWAVLGLRPGSSASAIREARRALAKRAHPDVGGTAIAMQQVNAAAAAALALIGADNEVTRVDPIPRSERRPGVRDAMRVVHDHPSFTIEALPVEAFEGLIVVASWLGELVTDDPPYELEVALTDPFRGWCRLDLVPDAGASTVSLTVAAEPGHPMPDLDRVRDAWVDGLNTLDWAALSDQLE